MIITGAITTQPSNKLRLTPPTLLARRRYANYPIAGNAAKRSESFPPIEQYDNSGIPRTRVARYLSE